MPGDVQGFATPMAVSRQKMTKYIEHKETAIKKNINKKTLKIPRTKVPCKNQSHLFSKTKSIMLT